MVTIKFNEVESVQVNLTGFEARVLMVYLGNTSYQEDACRLQSEDKADTINKIYEALEKELP